jgi:ParB-like nuclease domain
MTATTAQALRCAGCGAEGAIPLASIKDGGAQMRVEMRPETVADYAADMLDGAVFPPIVLYHDGADYWLADGFHRVAAAREIGCEEIVAEIREGTRRDAILHGIGANATHGLRRTQADKRRAVERLLTDPEWAAWSDRKIAELARVDHKTVGKVRRELSGEIPAPKTLSGEIPTVNGAPKERGSILADVLRSVPDDLLVAECRRRGLTVEAVGDA